MQDDKHLLENLNIRIGVEETNGDAESEKWFKGIIAPKLAFRRADGTTFDNRDEFIQKIRPSDLRETEVESIDLQGDRAIVKCIVTVKSAAGNNRFHNLRLFVRHEGEWKLIGWANETL